MNKEELLGFLLDDSVDCPKKCVSDEQVYSNWLKNGNDDQENPLQTSVDAAVAAPNKKKQIVAAQEDVDELLNGLEGIIGNADALSLKVKSKTKTKKTKSKPKKGSVHMEDHIVMLEVEDVSDVNTQEDANGTSPSSDRDRLKKKERRRKNTKELSYDELKEKLETITHKSRVESKDWKKKIHRLEKRNTELERHLEELKIENQTLIDINNRLSINMNEKEDATRSQKTKEKDRKRRERRTARRKEERTQEENKTPRSFPSSTDMNGMPIEF